MGRVNRYELDELAGRIAGDMRAAVEPFMAQIAFKVITDSYDILVTSTPVDTGYLRLSLTTAVNGDIAFVPGEKASSRAGHYTNQYRMTDKLAAESIGNFRLGDTIEIGYTANYAPYVEDRYHMMQNLTQLLPRIVGGAVAAVKRGLT